MWNKEEKVELFYSVLGVWIDCLVFTIKFSQPLLMPLLRSLQIRRKNRFESRWFVVFRILKFPPLKNHLISFTIFIQTTVPGILGGIVKGLKGGKTSQADSTKIQTSNFGYLEDIFFKPSFPDSLPTVAVADEKEVHLDIGFLPICLFIFELLANLPLKFHKSSIESLKFTTYQLSHRLL